jgi:diguanylate cyclase (GGDEF)-like protein
VTTLARQLFAGVSIIFLAGLAGIAGIYVANSRDYLQQQLESHAQDAATSLGLSLGGAREPDATFVETTIAAMFDRGHYERIAFMDVNGRRVVEKRLAPAAASVPEWFTTLLPLEPPTASSFVSQGWRQLGRVSVTSHATLAYRQLWETGLQTLAWLALIYVFALAAMRVFLSGLLRPLRQIEQTAAAIAERDYRHIEVLPRARELRVVVDAMNGLSDKVRRAIDAESGRAEQLRREAFHDALTGLWNRRGIEQQYETRVLHGREVFAVTLVLIELEHLAEFNRAHGFTRGDEALKLVAAALEAWSTRHGGVVGRWAGGSFVALAFNGPTAGAAQLADVLCRDIESGLAEQGFGPGAQAPLVFNAGTAAFEEGKPALGRLLAAADGALARVQLSGRSLEAVAVVHPADAAGGSLEWRERLTRLLAEDRLVLYGQPALQLSDGSRLHVEITSRLRDENGELLPAATFLPMAARHGLVPVVDRRMLEAVLGYLDREPRAAVAVNIAASTADPAFIAWLSERLRAHPDAARLLCFELSESGVMRDPESALAFGRSVRSVGARFAIDGFGVHRESLQLLKRLLPNYVKLSAAHTQSLSTDASSRFFVEAVARMARTLDIPVIAQAVESAELLPLLGELGIAGYQGYVAGLPALLE